MACVELLLYCSLLTLTICHGAVPLQVSVTGRSGPTSCVGDTVTYTCTVNSLSHTWRIGIDNLDVITVAPNDPTSDEFPFTAMVLNVNANPITSVLSVTSFDGLDGVNITCLNTLAPQQPETQDIIASVFAPPTPQLSVQRSGLTSFDFIITPSPSSECVTNYNINATRSDGIFMSFLVARTADPQITSTEDNFNLCAYSYNFTVAAVTGVESGEITDEDTHNALAPGLDTIEPDIDVTSQSSNVTVSWEPPEDNFINLTVAISRNEGSCMGPVNRSVDLDRTMEMLSLDCDTCNRRTLTFMVEYVDANGCSSMRAVFDRMIEDDSCQPATNPTTATTMRTGSDSSRTTTEDVNETSQLGTIVGVAVGGVAAVACVILLIVIIAFYVKKCKGKTTSSKDGIDGGNVKVQYHSAGPPSLEMSDPTPGSMYADPKAIEHEAAGETGDEYALVTSNTKGKKKANQPEAAVSVGDMYSVPDKSRKTQNQGLVYADIDVSRPPQRAAPQAPHGMPQQQPDNEPVTYATVAV